MKTLALIAAAGLGLAAAGCPTAAIAQAWQSINARQGNLYARIEQGVRGGQLTRTEATRLRVQFRQLAARETSYRRSGGGLSGWERADLNRRFDGLSNKIRNQRTDRQYR